MSTDVRVPGVSEGSIAPKAWPPARMSSAVGEELKDDGRSLRLVEQHLQARCRHIRRRSSRFLDAREQLLDSLGSDIGEPHRAYVPEAISFTRGSPTLHSVPAG